MTDLKRVPLRIPTGWAVTWNTFFEVELIIQDNILVNSADFSEDLLQIRPLTFDGTNYCIDNNAYLLDLGWYPAENPGGHYQLSLVRGQDWENVLRTYESRSLQDVRVTIDDWLEVLSEHWHDPLAHKHL